ncbi:MAG: ATP12 family chaperone protein [Alphaproteobacteria bacterium]
MKRVYRAVTTAPAAWGHTVRLDGRAVTTPRRRPLILPTPALAELVAAEWAAQDQTVAPDTMRVNRLATTAIDLMPERRTGAVEQVVDYVETDLLCYRAAFPVELAAAQARHWDPPLAWLAATHGIRLEVTTSMTPLAQPEAAIRAVAGLVAGLGDWPLVGLHALTTATGSVVLALMVHARRLSAAAAGEAALVDERFERARWGEEADARAREQRLLADLDAAERFLAALDGIGQR